MIRDQHLPRKKGQRIAKNGIEIFNGMRILMAKRERPRHSSHALSTVNAHKNKQQLVPILGTKPSVSALDPTTITRNNQKPQLQPITIATDSLADQNGVVTGVESKYSMPSNTFMALNEVFGTHSPSSYHIQSLSHKLDSPHNDIYLPRYPTPTWIAMCPLVVGPRVE
ncbi:hypothetical protein LguiB_013001 [Lonicera macranthoides]